MELKSYQQQVINDLILYLEEIQIERNPALAFYEFWTQHPRTPLQPFPGSAIEPYKDNIPQVPHVCIKVPTAGGKTFIACNAIKSIFDAFNYTRDKAVIWLVPSITILEQTLKNLEDSTHPYRQKINSQFGHKVAIYDKQSLLDGGSFNATSVSGQLNIFILSFDSLRARNKDDRKVYQENGNLQSFKNLIGDKEDISLIKVIQALNPVVIVDESHNAESDLSVEMLRNLNPSFILDLTATPRKNSNIISFVDALELKKEHMVKLPVIVYNHTDKTEVITSALQLRRKLEIQAEEETKRGGKYIRPIVLFQAQPKNASDNTTFEKLKEKLIELKIPSDQIKIKTANLNELKGIDLTSKDCPVRYIITVNALKEGWDCPFAYILASLADKSSSVDVEQILGRVLRQPYVTKHESSLLNLCYVLTASSRFLDTLDNIVKGLNRAGFSSKDFKIPELIAQEINGQKEINSPAPNTEIDFNNDATHDIDINRILAMEAIDNENSVSVIEKTALEQVRTFENGLKRSEENNLTFLPSEIQAMVKTFRLKEAFSKQAREIRLPQFFIRKPAGEIFSSEEQILNKEDLLEGFQLSKSDSNITFDNISSQLYRVDLDETKGDHTPSFVKIDGLRKDNLLNYILDPVHRPSRVKNYTARLLNLIGNMSPISEGEMKKYIAKILEDFTDEQYNDLANHEYSYSNRIGDKINSLTEKYAEGKFRELLVTEKIFIKPSYSFPEEIIPGNTSKDIVNSLYEKESQMNPFEERFINEIANLPNILFWTKNVERKHFRLNGFVNHYPDFIIQTKKGKTLVVETKGDDRDNSNSEAKIRLGAAWEKYAGSQFRYFMVFDKNEMKDAYTQNSFMNIIREL